MATAPHLVVVDGSNLATEGRTVPSLAQLDEAVRAYAAEDPAAEVLVVVDASFAHRIDAAERAQLEAAELHGEVVAPPAGAIGRGDAFILRIAERTGAVVLSNDSFQEFHEEHPWLFEEGRLIGGKPVPGVGWIFTPRRPVRGPRSGKKAVKTAEEPEEAPSAELSAPRKAAEVAKALRRAFRAGRAKTDGKAEGKKAKRAEKKEQAVHAPADAAPATKEPPTKLREPSLRAEGAKPAKAATGRGGRARKAVPADEGTGSTARPEKDAKKSAKREVKKHQAEQNAPVKQKAPVKEKAPAKATKNARRPAPPVGLKVAIDQATEEVLAAPPEVDSAGDGALATGGKRRRRVAPPPAVNEPLAFITFVAAHPLGSTLEGVVASFTSHGAMVDVALQDGGVLHCYVPLTGLGSPPPRAAREVLRRGQKSQFALVALDPPRRMAELALPELAGAPPAPDMAAGVGEQPAANVRRQ